MSYTKAQYRQAYLEIREENQKRHGDTALSERSVAAQITARARNIALNAKKP